MASIEIVDMTDDLDPRITNGVETVTIVHPVFGTKYEIELGESNRKHLLNHLAKLDKYFAAARLVEEPAPVVVSSAPKAKATGEKALIRAWAKANGYDVGDRGRIKAEIIDAYHAAHNGSAVEEPAPAAESEQTVTPVAENTTEPVVEVDDSEPTDSEIQAMESEGPVTAADVDDMIAELFAPELTDSESDQEEPVSTPPNDAPNKAERKEFGF